MPPNEPIPPHPQRYPKQKQPLRLRKRMKRREGPNEVRFLTFSCYHRLPLLTDPWIADFFLHTLGEARAERRCELFAYVVMPEHVHLLLRPHRDDTAADLLASVKTSVSQKVVNRWKREKNPLLAKITLGSTRHFWQPGGGFDRNVRNLTEFSKEVLYCHQNPVERGLVRSANEYTWSSVHRWLARHRGTPCADGPEIDPPPGKDHDWVKWRGFMEWDEGR